MAKKKAKHETPAGFVRCKFLKSIDDHKKNEVKDLVERRFKTYLARGIVKAVE